MVGAFVTEQLVQQSNLNGRRGKDERFDVFGNSIPNYKVTLTVDRDITLFFQKVDELSRLSFYLLRRSHDFVAYFVVSEATEPICVACTLVKLVEHVFKAPLYPCHHLLSLFLAILGIE